MTKEVDASNWFILAMAFWQKRDKALAREWFDKAVAWTKEKDPTNDDLRRFWAESAELLGGPGPGTKPGIAPAETRPGTTR
jgi:hypothetical protein